MEILSGVDKQVAVGDEVTVLGTQERDKSILPFPGEVVEVGPNLVEISATSRRATAAAPSSTKNRKGHRPRHLVLDGPPPYPADRPVRAALYTTPAR